MNQAKPRAQSKSNQIINQDSNKQLPDVFKELQEMRRMNVVKELDPGQARKIKKANKKFKVDVPKTKIETLAVREFNMIGIIIGLMIFTVVPSLVLAEPKVLLFLQQHMRKKKRLLLEIMKQMSSQLI